MGFVFVVLAVTVGIICLWGLFAPRGQWIALSSWSFSDPHAGEPSGAAYAVRRLASALGLVATLIVVAVSAPGLSFATQTTERPPSDVDIMWGEPNPTIVNRDVIGIAAPPGGLVEVPIEGYQAFGDDGVPEYLQRLKTFTRLGTESIPGYIGTVPDVGFSALDFATMIVHVRGAILCVPRQAVVIETEETVQIGVFYGLPNPTDGSVPDNEKECANGQPLTGSVLLPIKLLAPVGDRSVQALDGTELTEVDVVEE